jgi:hypothetical protein
MQAKSLSSPNSIPSALRVSVTPLLNTTRLSSAATKSSLDEEIAARVRCPPLRIGKHCGVTRYISVVSLTAMDDLGRVMAQAA